MRSGVVVICLLSLSDQGTPAYDSHHAAQLAALGIPTFACTPDQFPELMAAAIQRQDIGTWASRQRHPARALGVRAQTRWATSTSKRFTLRAARNWYSRWEMSSRGRGR